MKLALGLFFGLSLPLVILLAADKDQIQETQKPSNLTMNAPRPINMANPKKPAWLAERHGK